MDRDSTLESFERAVATVRDRLESIRALIDAVDAERLGVTATQMQALRSGYDIYARMLTDALTDLADELRAGATYQLMGEKQ